MTLSNLWLKDLPKWLKWSKVNGKYIIKPKNQDTNINILPDININMEIQELEEKIEELEDRIDGIESETDRINDIESRVDYDLHDRIAELEDFIEENKEIIENLNKLFNEKKQGEKTW